MNHKRAHETFLAHYNQNLASGDAAWTHGGPKFSFGSKFKAKENVKEVEDTLHHRSVLYPMHNDREVESSVSYIGPTFGHRREAKVEDKPGPGHYRTVADDRMQWQAVSFKGRRTDTGPRMGADSPGPASYNTSCSTLGVATSSGCNEKGRRRK